MTRPTKEQIEQALELNELGVIHMPTQDVPELLVVDVLADEVRALREELDLSERDRKNVRASVAHACAEADKRVDAACAALNRARSIIGRVEALPAKWRAKAGWFRPPLFTNAEHTLITNTYEGCADELEAALKGLS